MKRPFALASVFALFCAVVLGQQAANPATGLWQIDGVAAGPWSIQLTQNGNTLTGTVRQTGAQGGPVTISDGSITGSTLTFKAISPDGARTITFNGSIKGEEIEFKRAVEVRNNTVGGAGIFGGRGLTEFTVKRVNENEAAPAAPATGARGARGARGAASSAPVNPTNSPDGRWTATTNGASPWTFEFKSNGSTLTGTVKQNGPPETPVTISEGKIDGTRITFKVTSPDAARTITFQGRISGGEISFVRQFNVRAGAPRGGNDLYGALSSLQFVAKKAAE